MRCLTCGKRSLELLGPQALRHELKRQRRAHDSADAKMGFYSHPRSRPQTEKGVIRDCGAIVLFVSPWAELRQNPEATPRPRRLALLTPLSCSPSSPSGSLLAGSPAPQPTTSDYPIAHCTVPPEAKACELCSYPASARAEELCGSSVSVGVVFVNELALAPTAPREQS